MNERKDRDAEYSAAETAKRRDEVVRRMANTPPDHTTHPRPRKKGKPAGAGRAKPRARGKT